MKKLSVLLLLLFTVCVINAQVNYVSISDEAQYGKVSDFSNTYEININEHGKNNISKCQAVRLDRYWYVTAAHCVVPMCDNACSMRARLVVGPDYEMDITTTHINNKENKDKSKVFLHPQASVSTGKMAGYDIALLYFDPRDSKYVYTNPANNRPISEALFMQKVPDYNTYYKATKGTNIPPILGVVKMSAQIDRNISVISIWDGKRSVMQSSKDLFLLPQLNFLFTENFGIVRGVSGSGVMTNKGELIGIVSATANLELVEAGARRKSKPIVFFTAFDSSVLEFIVRHVENPSYNLVRKKDYLELSPETRKYIGQVEQASQAMKLN